jgi:hypothetical protein
MFFTYASRILSILLLLIGTFLILTAVAIVSGYTGLSYEEALARYLPASKTTGEAIDKGSLYILIAVALGTLSEMSFVLRSMRDKL